MECKEFEKLIPEFIAHKLDFFTMEQFTEHMKFCPGCSEELEIQFLVAEGMQRLEEGDAFDLQTELELQLEETERKIRFHRMFMRIGELFEVIAVLAVAACAFGILW